jgi:hypothetical protein
MPDGSAPEHYEGDLAESFALDRAFIRPGGSSGLEPAVTSLPSSEPGIELRPISPKLISVKSWLGQISTETQPPAVPSRGPTHIGYSPPM